MNLIHFEIYRILKVLNFNNKKSLLIDQYEIIDSNSIVNKTEDSLISMVSNAIKLKENLEIINFDLE